jgi:type II secretory pathway pseudopilin PulG
MRNSARGFKPSAGCRPGAQECFRLDSQSHPADSPMHTAKRSLPATTCQSGFTLLGLLFLVAIMGMSLAAAGTLWHTASQRQKEQELLFVGDQYRRAIESFWNMPLPAGTPRRLPENFDELIEDPRFPQTVRHLRRIYPDPMTRSAEWGVVKAQDGGIAGVYSLSKGEPFRKANFPSPYQAFNGQPGYSGWKFIFAAGNPDAAAPANDAALPANAPDGTANLNSPAAENEAFEDTERLKKVNACYAARTQGNLACQAVLKKSGQAAASACANPVSAQFSKCLSGL